MALTDTLGTSRLGTRLLGDRARRPAPTEFGQCQFAPGHADQVAPAMTALMESSTDGIVVLQAVRDCGTIIDFEFVMVSATAERLVHQVAADLLGKRLSTIITDIPTARFADYVTAVETGTARTTRMQFPGWTERWFDVSAMGFSQEGLVTIFRDVTDAVRHDALVDGLHRRQEVLERQALTDPLTGLGNRLLIDSRLEHAMSRLDRRETLVAVAFIDLDGLKPINDAHGHAVGDAVLIEIGRRLASVTRPYDTVGRIGGDEFVVLCEDLDDNDDVDKIVRRFVARCSEPIQVGGREVCVAASVGVTVADSSNTDPCALLDEADMAMYRAKVKGGDRIEYFDVATQDRVSLRQDLEAELRRALDMNELDIDFDSVLAPDRSNIAFRATVGWTHPRHGVIDGPTLHDVANTIGNVRALTDWVLDRALAIVAPWMSSPVGRVLPFVIVDVDSGVLTGPGFTERLIDALERNGVDPPSICIAVDGAYMVDHIDEVKVVLDRVATLGVRVAREGVMTATASHTYLCELPISIIILDDSLTNDLCETDRELLGVVIRTAKGGSRLVMAPARNATQFDILVSLGADLVEYRLPEPPSSAPGPH